MIRSVCRGFDKSVFLPEAGSGIWSAECENALWNIAGEGLLLCCSVAAALILGQRRPGDIKFAVNSYVKLL